MRRSGSQLVVPLDQELASWLETKAMEGYKKASLVRAVLHREMDAEALAKDAAGTEAAAESEEGEDDGGEEDGEE